MEHGSNFADFYLRKLVGFELRSAVIYQVIHPCPATDPSIDDNLASDLDAAK